MGKKNAQLSKTSNRIRITARCVDCFDRPEVNTFGFRCFSCYGTTKAAPASSTSSVKLLSHEESKQMALAALFSSGYMK